MQPDAPIVLRLARAFEEQFIGKRAPDDDFVSVMMANKARAALRSILIPDVAVTMAFHKAVGRPIGKTAEEVWAAMLTAAIGEPANQDE